MIQWLLATKLGRWAVGAAAAISIVSLALLRAFLAGQAKERVKHTQATLEAVRQRTKIENEVDGMSPDARRQRLREWTRG